MMNKIFLYATFIVSCMAILSSCASHFLSIKSIKKDIHFHLIKTVHFDTDSNVVNKRAMSIVKNNYSWMKQNSSAVLILAGYCDERGSNSYNLSLGDRRARSVKSAMVRLGVDDDRMSIISYGEKKPLDRGHDEIAWQKNRRVEFIPR